MTHMIKIEAEDGHTLEAAVAGDPDTARGGVVVLQEIFGLNEHIRDLPRRFAEAGYYAVAPAMFDRADVSYYGGELPSKAGLVAHCPVLAHFGERDQTIPMEGVKTFIKAQVDADPAVISHIYDADHGFNCDARGQFDASAAEMAWERTLAFLDRVSR